MTTDRQIACAVDPVALAELGKTAARLSDTSGLSLTEAVVRTIGSQKLSAEQVRRVVEHCNVEAVNRKFASISGVDRITHIDGGPADPSQVLAQLKVASAPRVTSIDALEYTIPEKVASVRPLANLQVPAPNLGELRDKLAAAADEIVSRTDASSFRMESALQALRSHVKTAALEGATGGELCDAWLHVGPAPLVKLAQRLLRDVFPAGEKVAGRRLDPSHPVVALFGEFAKLAERHHVETLARQELEMQLGRVDTFIRRSSL